MQKEPAPYVMIAEDDPDDQFLIQAALEEGPARSFTARFFATGEDLLQALHNCTRKYSPLPGLILLDLTLPGLDGREVLKKIRRDHRFALLPVAVLTGSGSPEDVRYCQRYRVSGYFHKPSTSFELKMIISYLMEEFLGEN